MSEDEEEEQVVAATAKKSWWNTIFPSSLQRQEVTNVHDGTLLDHLKNVYCATASALCYGLAIGCYMIVYWKYDQEVQSITSMQSAKCTGFLFILDITSSAFAPVLIAWFGYGPVSICLNLTRGLMCFLTWTYYLPNPPFPHYMFSFIIGSVAIANPQFIVGGTVIDSWLFVQYPQYRLMGSFVAIIVGLTGVAVSNILIYFTNNVGMSLLTVTCLIISITSVETYLYVCEKCFREPHDNSFTLLDFAKILKHFCEVDLAIKAWTADAVLAIMWTHFGYYYPLFASQGDTIDDLVQAIIFVGCPCVFIGMVSVVSLFTYISWGIADNKALYNVLLKYHIIVSFVGAVVYAFPLFFAKGTLSRLAIVGISMGQNLVTPNAMIMMLSVPPQEVIPYTAFAQGTFICISYAGAIWLNFYGNTFSSFAVAYGILILSVSGLSLMVLSLFGIYESVHMNRNKHIDATDKIYRGSRHSYSAKIHASCSY